MTRDEILSMQPGRELDEHIAIRLFGYRWCATDGGHYDQSMDGGKRGRFVKTRVRRFLAPGWDTGKHAKGWAHWNTVECTEAELALPIGYSYWGDGPMLSYSKSWEGMRLVVDAMAAKGWSMRLASPGGHKKLWSADFINPYKHISAEGETAPHAVCIASWLAYRCEK